MPSRTLENALLEQRMKGAIIIDFCAQNENWSCSLKMKDEQAMLTFPFSVMLSYACSPTLEAKSHASVLKESKSKPE